MELQKENNPKKRKSESFKMLHFTFKLLQCFDRKSHKKISQNKHLT